MIPTLGSTAEKLCDMVSSKCSVLYSSKAVENRWTNLGPKYRKKHKPADGISFSCRQPSMLSSCFLCCMTSPLVRDFKIHVYVLAMGVNASRVCWGQTRRFPPPIAFQGPSEENDDRVGLSTELIPRSALSPPTACIIKYKVTR